MPLRWASCLFRGAKGSTASLEINPSACPTELQDLLSLRGTACLRPRGSHILYERVHDTGQGAFTPPVLIYIKRLPVCGGLDVCIKRTLVTHFVCRAAREARLQVQLQHPHLLPALACARGQRHYYLVLPAASADLWAEAEAMRQQGTGYSEGQLREIARQVLLGLDHLHSGNLAHRDIKPANILRMRDGTVMVADFGCADSHMSGFVAAGTAQFQPPECRRNSGAQLAVLAKGYDQRMQDMWSVGTTLASLWFAQLPEVIRGTGCSQVPSAAAAAAAVAAAAVAAAPGGGGGGGEPCGSLKSTNSNTLSAAAVASGNQLSGACGRGGGDTALLLLPPFLAAAGFASCTSTVGARGTVPSEQFMDLLSRLLRLRPSERLTVSQALQHEWLLGTSCGGGGGGSVPRQVLHEAPAAAAPVAPAEAGGICAEAVTPVMVSLQTVPAVVAAEMAAGLLPSPMSSPPLTPTEHMTAIEADRFLQPFMWHPRSLLQQSSSSPPMTPLPPASTMMPPAAAAAAAALTPTTSVDRRECSGEGALVGHFSSGHHRQERRPYYQRQQQQQTQSHCSLNSTATTTTTTTTSTINSNSSSSPIDAATPQSGAPRRRFHSQLQKTGMPASAPRGLPGHSFSHDGRSAECFRKQVAQYPGEGGQQQLLALRRQQQQQQQQQQQREQQQEQQQQELQQQQPQSALSWLQRPSSREHHPKHAQRAILRVFVGASGDSSGSN